MMKEMFVLKPVGDSALSFLGLIIVVKNVRLISAFEFFVMRFTEIYISTRPLLITDLSDAQNIDGRALYESQATLQLISNITFTVLIVLTWTLENYCADLLAVF